MLPWLMCGLSVLRFIGCLVPQLLFLIPQFVGVLGCSAPWFVCPSVGKSLDHSLVDLLVSQSPH